MAFSVNCRIENVSLAHVNIKNDDFRISRLSVTERLRQSVRENGLLELPVLFNRNNEYIIISGHNRLSVLRELNISSFSSVVVNSLDREDFINFAILKNYRNETGCIGKLKFILILKNKFRMDEKDIHPAAKKMQIPEDLLNNDSIEKTLRLPLHLSEYIDSKDLGFKALKIILHMPDDALSLLSVWVMDPGMRVNIFRGIIDLIFDIYKRDKSIDSLRAIDSTALKDKRKKEEFLYSEIYKIRYPEFYRLKSRAAEFIDNLEKNGIEVDFPEFMERDNIELILKINKRDNPELFRNRINQIDLNSIKGLLNLL